MNNSSTEAGKFAVLGSLAAIILVDALLLLNHVDTSLSVYGGWFEQYAWEHADLSLDSQRQINLMYATGGSGILGAVLGGLIGSRVPKRS